MSRASDRRSIMLTSTERPLAVASMRQPTPVTTLERTRWKVSAAGGAAEALGLKPTTLEARMKKLGIARPLA